MNENENLNCDTAEEYYEYLRNAERKKRNKRPFDFAALGLLLDAFFGIGAIFSFISLLMLKSLPEKTGKGYKWAKAVGITGLVFGVAFFTLSCICLAR